MDNKLYEMLDDISAEELSAAASLLDDIAENCTMPHSSEARIRSAVMRKAGTDMKDNTMNRTRKHTKRFTTMIAAAALLTTCAVGAGAYYTVGGGTWNGLRNAFGYYEDAPETIPENKMQAVENITVHKGELIENTFDNIDVTFEGLVSDINVSEGVSYASSSGYLIFTLRKTDGTRFEQPPEGMRYAVLYTEENYQQNGWQPLYKDDIYNIRANEDGSLSVTIEGGLHHVIKAAEAKDYPVRVGFENLYLESDYVTKVIGEPDDSFGDNAKVVAIGNLTVDTCNAFAHVINGSSYLTEEVTSDTEFSRTWSGDPADEDNELNANFKALKEQLIAAHEEIASEVYNGEVIFDIDPSELNTSDKTYTAEYKGTPITIYVNPLRIIVTGTDDRAYGFYDENPTPPTLTLTYADGTSQVFEPRGCGASGKVGDAGYRWEIDYEDNEPFDPESITSITFDNVTVDTAEYTDPYTYTAEYKLLPLNVRVTPLTITVSGDGNKFDDEIPSPITIHYADGSEQTIANDGWGWGGTNTEEAWFVNYKDNEPFDPESITSITFDSVTVDTAE